jgi:hypothetical protein
MEIDVDESDYEPQTQSFTPEPPPSRQVRTIQAEERLSRLQILFKTENRWWVGTLRQFLDEVRVNNFSALPSPSFPLKDINHLHMLPSSRKGDSFVQILCREPNLNDFFLCSESLRPTQGHFCRPPPQTAILRIICFFWTHITLLVRPL